MMPPFLLRNKKICAIVAQCGNLRSLNDLVGKTCVSGLCLKVPVLLIEAIVKGVKMKG